ncbi:MAG: helix-turn-helix domain-containing protein [Bacteroidales bacterium]|nr:helix-turn-helix domain-containing protein [Bacteroidales bacterium]
MNLNNIEQRLKNIELLLSSQKTILTFKEAAAYLGLSKSYLYKLTSAERISHYKPQGKLIYFKKNELDNWLLRNRNVTKKEIEKMALSFVTLNKKGATHE